MPAKHDRLITCLIIGIVFYFIPFNKTLAENWQKYSANPILNIGPSGSWDSKNISSPNVIFNGIQYEMWYGGDDGSKWSIGYATSNDGIYWQKSLTSPILVPDISIANETDVTEPFVIKEGEIYKIWYTSIKPYTSSGNEVYRINYATSTDNKTWTKQSIPVLRAVPNSWESEGVAKPSIVKTNNGYQLWYAGRGSDGNWAIGTATSTNGIDWIRDSHNPILLNVSAPNVLLEANNLFYLWYHAAYPTKISYRTSVNGIFDWQSENPVLSIGPANSFDQIFVAAPFVLKQDGSYKMWYAGYDSHSWRIGLASNSVLPTPTPLPTETPTPMPTEIPTSIPTPLPTDIPTPLPTPTSIPTRKVIVIPGMGASWSGDLLKCDLSSSGTWANTPVYGDMYLSLINSLISRGYTVLPYYYDWRQDMRTHAVPFASFISSQTATNEKVNIIGHSMGGLVARAYVDYDGVSEKVDRLFTAGTPHRGTPHAYPALAAGETWIDDAAFKFAFTFIKKWCGALTGLSDREVVQQLIPSVYNLLPIDLYLIDQKTGLPKQGSLQNNWLSGSPFNTSQLGMTLGTLSGNTYKTLSQITVTDKTKKSGDWIDGKPTKKETTMAGDGTIVISSSSIAGPPNINLNLDHTGLVTSPDAIRAILEFLGITTNQPVTSTALIPSSSIAIIASPAWFWLTEPSGHKTHDTQGLIVIANPTKGNYKLTVIPQTIKETRIAVAQFLKNGQILWKEYRHQGAFPKFGTVAIDPDNPSEDILH